MKLDLAPRLSDADKIPTGFYKAVSDALKAVAQTCNGLSEGRVEATYNAATAAPTAGNYAVGDIVRNASPSELGVALSKYVITGWMCTASSPLTFVPLRSLTGN